MTKSKFNHRQATNLPPQIVGRRHRFSSLRYRLIAAGSSSSACLAEPLYDVVSLCGVSAKLYDNTQILFSQNMKRSDELQYSTVYHVDEVVNKKGTRFVRMPESFL